MPKRILANTNIDACMPNSSCADAILIEDGLIKAIGTSSNLISQFGRNAKVENLNRSILLPSFTDSHIHLLAYGLSLQRVSVETQNKQDCLDRIAGVLKGLEPGKWVIGHGWDHNKWDDGYGSKNDLDVLSVQHPIYLTHKSLHSGWANSLALKKAAINSDTSDPEGGTIQRDSSGEPTGIVLEKAMMIIESVIPEPIAMERESAILEAQTALHKYGITAVHDFDPWSIYDTFNILIDNGLLSLRITKSIPELFLDEAIENGYKSGDGNDWLKIGWLKLFADGALGPQTAAMLSPYENSDSTGMLFLSQQAIESFGEKALSNGIALAVHAIGDRANRETLLAMAQLDKSGLLKIPSLKSRIEHVQLINEKDIRLFAKHDIAASMQPIHAISDMEMAAFYWGNRCAHAYAWNSILRSGARLIFGSDAPVETPNPILGLHAALLRKQHSHHSSKNLSWVPDQCISLQAAINAFSSAPSMLGGFGGLIGKIAEGYAADLVLLPGNLFNIDSDDIQFISPLATMSGGKWVYKNDNINIDIN